MQGQGRHLAAAQGHVRATRGSEISGKQSLKQQKSEERSKEEDEKVGTWDLPFSPPKFCLIFFANHLNSQSYPGCEKTDNH